MSKSAARSVDSVTEPKPSVLKPGTKKAQLAQLLKPRKGVTIEALSTTLGWQAHTTRAAISGLRKAGFEVERISADDGSKTSCYRLAGRVS
ncbi:DUF3489 domain-containing protein [Marinicauda algicola]|uniref:DUF3489 domain-containing protein n=1 Tax=Marinicauda algicola TaxID=2029849 RepID=A0A4S2H421_9PROT|nr:DUF3489 domain-containing protein [Marinicauda algicola]TGY90138.1 DUF3489 domain-containing protein [Marinicauda algicola]